jgi:hypothetical protein
VPAKFTLGCPPIAGLVEAPHWDMRYRLSSIAVAALPRHEHERSDLREYAGEQWTTPFTRRSMG